MRVIVLCLCLFSAAMAAQRYTSGVQYRGVSVSGAEVPGAPLWPYLASNTYFVSQGVNLIRIPFLWERLHPFDNTSRPLYNTDGSVYLNGPYWMYLSNLVANVTGSGAVAVLDMHNNARYPTATSGAGFIGKDSNATYTDFFNIWKFLGRFYKDNTLVWYGIQNEPFADPNNIGGYTAQDAYNLASNGLWGVRSGGATAKVLVTGTAHTAANSWTTSGVYGTPNSNVFNTPIPSANNAGQAGDTNYAVTVHTYFDSGYAGVVTQCLPYNATSVLGPITSWAKSNNIQLFLGQWAFYVYPFVGSAAPTDTQCTNNALSVLNYLNSNAALTNNGPWIGWAYWAAGPWRGDDQVGYNTYTANNATLSASASAEPFWWSVANCATCSTCNPDGPIASCGHTTRAVTKWLSTSHGVNGTNPTWISAQWNPPYTSANCPSSQQNAQCGGQSWAGETCCPNGYVCNATNTYYYQCIYSFTPSTSTTAPANTVTTNCVAAYSQCGGSNPNTNNPWTGGTTCCPGTSCIILDQYYWQCLPPTKRSPGLA